jgi:hypothetical protein
MCDGDCGSGEWTDEELDQCLICQEPVERCRENLTATGRYIHPECRPE